MLSTENKVFVPDLYFSRDKLACEFLMDNIRHQETCSVVTMQDNGKNYLFVNLTERLAGEQLVHHVEARKLFSDEELHALLSLMKGTSRPTVYVLYIDVMHDISWFVHELSVLRKRKGHGFITCLFCHVGNVWQALLDGESAVMHEQIALKPVSFGDAVAYIESDAARFDFRPTEQQIAEIYHWSYGHAGLIKTLMLVKRQYPTVPFTTGFLLDRPAVVERLQKIMSDFTSDLKVRLSKHQLRPAECALLERFGYLDDNGNLFHPLLNRLLTRAIARDSSSTLSKAENKVLGYFLQHADTLVSRNDIARIVWGEDDWESKYSDWAIGQLVYRLRQKLVMSERPGAITTVRGKGFLYRQVV